MQCLLQGSAPSPCCPTCTLARAPASSPPPLLPGIGTPITWQQPASHRSIPGHTNAKVMVCKESQKAKVVVIPPGSPCSPLLLLSLPPAWATLCSSCCLLRAKKEQRPKEQRCPFLTAAAPRVCQSQWAGEVVRTTRPPTALCSSSSLWPPSRAVSPGTHSRQAALATQPSWPTASHQQPPALARTPHMAPPSQAHTLCAEQSAQLSLRCPTATVALSDMATSPAVSSLSPSSNPARVNSSPGSHRALGSCAPPHQRLWWDSSRRGFGQAPSPLSNRR